MENTIVKRKDIEDDLVHAFISKEAKKAKDLLNEREAFWTLMDNCAKAPWSLKYIFFESSIHTYTISVLAQNFSIDIQIIDLTLKEAGEGGGSKCPIGQEIGIIYY